MLPVRCRLRFFSFESNFREHTRVSRQKFLKDLKLAPQDNSSSTKESFWQELQNEDNKRVREARRPRSKEHDQEESRGKYGKMAPIPKFEDDPNIDTLLPPQLEGNQGHFATISVVKEPTEISLLQKEKNDLTAEIGEALAVADPHEVALLTMRPEFIPIQQNLTRARSVSEVLDISQQEMDAINTATALHRLGKLVTPYVRANLTQDPRFQDLIKNAEHILPDLTPRGVANIFWGLVRLEYSPRWIPKLLQASHQSLTICDAAHLSTTLYCLGKMPSLYAIPEGEALKKSVSEAIVERIDEFESNLDIVCVLAAMSKLKIKNELVYQKLAEKAKNNLQTFEFTDLASIAWSYANIGLTEGKLFKALRQRLENEIEFCTPKALVQLIWAFSKAEESDEELFRYVLAPAVRSYLLDLKTKDLCTILWSFCNAQIKDDDLFCDLAQALVPKVKEMNAHDVASVVVAFATVDFQGAPALYKKLARHTVNLQSTFSPLQVSRALYGFGCAQLQDLRVMEVLLEEAHSKRHLLYGRNVTDILTGLAETGYFPKVHLPWLFEHATKSVSRLSAEDTIALMYVLSRIPPELRDMSTVRDLPETLLDHLKERHKGWWRFHATEVADVLESLKNLKIPDEFLTEHILRQLPVSLLAADASLQVFLRLLGELASQPTQMAELVRTHLHKRPKVREAICKRLAEVLRLDLDFHHTVLLYTTLASLGLDTEEETRKLVERCKEMLENEDEDTSNIEDIGHLCWALCEMNWEPQLALDLAFRFVEQGILYDEDEGEMGPEVPLSQILLLKIGWAFCVLNEPVPTPLIESIAANRKLPKDDLLYMAQAIAWDVRDQVDELSPQVLSWLQDVREVPRSDIHQLPKSPSKQPSRAKEYPSSKWISDMLIELQVPHQKLFVVQNTHRATIGFTKERHVIDVTSFRDTTVPDLRITGSCALRRRQMVEMGYTVSEASLRDLWTAMRDKTGRQFVGRLLPKVGNHPNPEVFLPPQLGPGQKIDPFTEDIIKDLYGTKQKVTILPQGEKKRLKV